MALRVLIAGGGLGGLTLAHGLRQAGLEPTVFERGPAAIDLTTSYRIHIDAAGSRALLLCLPGKLWELFERKSAAPPRGIAFATEHLDQLAFIADPASAHDPGARAHPISRAGLRQLLLTDLQEVVRFDARVVGYDHSSDGPVVVHLADGSSARGDVLVGADGSASAVRKQLLPRARVIDTGVAGIAGKVYLSERIRERIGSQLLSQMTMVLPLRNAAMFMAPFVARANHPHSAEALDMPEHLFWVVLSHANALGLTPGSGQHSATELRQLALHNTEGVHDLLHELIAEAEPSSLVGVPLHTAQPVTPWETSRVTLLGDAVHTMTPLQGLGGNMALLDAALLCKRLVDADRGRMELLSAIAAYEAHMRQYGFDAVRRSLQVSNSVASGNMLGRLMFRSVLRAADVLPWLSQMLFRRPSLAPAM